jgi:hypothetical protein
VSARAISLPETAIGPDPAFLGLVANWSRDQAGVMLGFVWKAYEVMRSEMPAVDRRDLERSITQLLEPRIRDVMTGDEPFYVQHGPYEHETMAPAPAQPPAYDIAFVVRADERVMWPIEAKVLETPLRVADYARDVRSEFLTCRYSPFSSAGAMIGYLLTGGATDALQAIASELECELSPVPLFERRPHRVSSHDRAVPVGKPYPAKFHCHHLILEYPDLSRARPTTSHRMSKPRRGRKKH